MRRNLNGEKCLRNGTVVFLLGVFWGAAVSWAQLPTATILGVVRDASGAVVPQAALTARNVETGQTRTTVSAANGSYRFAALPVGSYEVQVTQSGFQSAVRSGLTLTVGQEAVVNFSLQVGAVEQRVEVSAEAPLVNTTSGTLGGLVDEQKVAELPLNGRNYVELALLQPGVQRSRVFNFGGDRRMTAYSSSGAPVTSNITLLDGAQANSMRSGSTATSASGGTLGVEGIREFKVVTNALSAEYGMAMGSQIVLATKSGTNTFHGTLFEYHRNDDLDARNFFDFGADREVNPRRVPPFVRNQFGGSLGGPIVRDRTFFHTNLELLRERLSRTRVAEVLPTRCKVDGGCVPRIDPVVKNLLDIWPDPNLPGNRFADNPSQTTNQYYGQVRVDHTFSGTDSLFGRYTVDDTGAVAPRNLPGVGRSDASRGQYLTFSETHIFSPTVINQARFSYSRPHTGSFVVYTTEKFGQPGPGVSLLPGQPLGEVIVGELEEWNPGGNDPTEFNMRVFTWSDDVFYTRGAHSLKFGALINNYEQFLIVNHDRKGVIEFPDIETFLTGKPSSFSGATPGSVFNRQMRVNTFGFYVQDDWAVRPGLTLNLGLRYEFSGQQNEVSGADVALRNITDNQGTRGIPFQNSSKRNFSPRVGFAWDIFGNSTTALRGGFGLLYDLANMGTAFRSGSIVPPLGSLRSFGTEDLQGPFTLPITVPACPPDDPTRCGRSFEILDFHLKQPRLYQWNLTVERQFPWEMALSVSYRGTRGVRLFQLREGNPTPAQILPDGQRFWLGNEPRTNPNWDDIVMLTAGGGSWYNGLQVGLSKRATHGLQFQTSYTWSKVLDDTQGQGFGELNRIQGDMGADPGNIHYDWGPASFDYAHNFTQNAIYHLPNFVGSGAMGKLLNGWWMSGILSLNTGFTFTPTIQRQWARSFIRGEEIRIDRPNVKPGRNNDNIILGGPEKYFDFNAFELQPRGFKGNSSRGMLRGPGLATLDFSVVKDTAVSFLGEGGKLQFRAEFFNLFNRVNFAWPRARVFAGRRENEAPFSNAGRINETIGTSRQIQLALRLEF